MKIVDFIGEIFPELLVATISLGFSISTLLNTNRGNNVLPALLLVTFFSSSIALLIRRKIELAIARRCTWKPSSQAKMASACRSSETTATARAMREDHSISGGANVRHTVVSDSSEPSDQEGAIRKAVAIFSHPCLVENCHIDDDGNPRDGESETDNTTDISSEALEANPQYDRKNVRFKLWLWNEVVKSFLRPSQITLLLLHGPALTLLLYLTARLSAVNNFQTRPINLDFGPDYGIVESDGSYHSNRAFISLGSSFARAMYGFLTAFLSFPAASGAFARTCRKSFPRRTNGRGAVLLTTFTYSITSSYPTYNLVKRLIKNDMIASSSYANECFEWTMGYVMGLGAGMLMTSVSAWLMMVYMPNKYDGGIVAYMETFEVRHKLKTSHEPKEEEKKEGKEETEAKQDAESWNDHNHIESAKVTRIYNFEYAFGKIEEYAVLESKTQSCCKLCKALFCDMCHVDMLIITNTVNFIFLLVFMVSTLGCGICLGGTWNSCEMDNDDCINSKKNGVDWKYWLLFIFILLFGVIEGAFYWFVRYRPVHANSK